MPLQLELLAGCVAGQPLQCQPPKAQVHWLAP
jgi:hypothetical protein